MRITLIKKQICILAIALSILVTFPIGASAMPDLSEHVKSISYFVNVGGIFDHEHLEPITTKITSVAELTDFLVAYDDETKVLLSENYDGSFFDDSFLAFIVLMERSGSNQLKVSSVHEKNGLIDIEIERIAPTDGLPNIAFWHIVIEIDRVLVDKDVSVTISTTTGPCVGGHTPKASNCLQCEYCPADLPRSCTSGNLCAYHFGNPSTGIPNITGYMMAMFTFLIMSAGLWGYFVFAQ